MTKLQVTLKDLRANHACVSGYNKLVCALTGQKFDKKRETYIRRRHEEPISIEYILGSNGLDDALWALRAVPDVDRDCRRYALWCARRVQHLMDDKRSIAALDVAERHADGLATDDELVSARAAAQYAALAAAWAAAETAAQAAARDAALDAARDAAWDAALAAAEAAAWAAARGAARGAARDAAQVAAWDAQADMLRKMCRGEAPWQVAK